MGGPEEVCGRIQGTLNKGAEGSRVRGPKQDFSLYDLNPCPLEPLTLGSFSIPNMASERYELLTWKDPKTGLQWQWDSPGEMTWHKAREYASSLTLDGKNDWRLPTLAELESLLDRTKGRSDGRPLMREEVPFRDELSYWSSTTFERDTQNAWIVMFDGAYLLSYYKSNLYHVRCIRG